MIGLPPCDAVTLVTTPADGGCVRTRFFNGMFITREDLETEQRYHRLKSRLHNRAAGAGVVWGFKVGRQGDAVCVTPGYGVDCCGNDLVLTTMYEVPIAALLADPAAAPVVCARGPHRMHLLLEYIECPSEPRPVHGDPCAPHARCETSRIRELVRLRLVPPCDYPVPRESGPIGRFLDEVNDLRKRFPLEMGPAPAGTLSQAPFALSITVAGPNNQSTTVTVPASVDISTTDFKNKYPDLFRFRAASITVEAVQNAGWSRPSPIMPSCTGSPSSISGVRGKWSAPMLGSVSRDQCVGGRVVVEVRRCVGRQFREDRERGFLPNSTPHWSNELMFHTAALGEHTVLVERGQLPSACGVSPRRGSWWSGRLPSNVRCRTWNSGTPSARTSSGVFRTRGPRSARGSSR